VAIEVISAETMTSNATSHSARCVGEDRWTVTWLPGRVLSGEQAVTAMTIASTVAGHQAPATDPLSDAEWAVLDDWALELGITAAEAAALLAVEPGPHPSLPA
jgi:hypothetical protein